LEVLGGVESETPVRLVTEQEVISDYFTELLEERSGVTVKLRGSHWLGSKVKAAVELPGLDESRRMQRPAVGSLGRWFGLESTWDQRLASPLGGLAIVGTLSWLQDDLRAAITTDVDPTSGTVVKPLQMADTIAQLLLPWESGGATWFTRLFASSGLADRLPLPMDASAVILDGAGAIKYLSEIEAPVVICIVDRSVADETAAEIVVQLRNSRGEPVSLKEELGWHPPPGVEALAYMVPL
jgi:hypothetical protein